MIDFGVAAENEIARLSLGAASEPPPPPPPDVTSSGIIPVEITDKFTEAVKTLAPGELVKDGLFTLFDSVAALEIMDPKMDSGCVEPGEEFEELYDVSRTLLPEEVLGIMDQLLCHEMSWHLGYPLSQTLFTSVYIEALLMPKAPSLDEAQFVRQKDATTEQQPMLEVLRAYCLGLLKACGHVNERIRSEHYYEEEDFVTNTYHRVLLDDVPTPEVEDVLINAIHVVDAQRGSMRDAILDGLVSRLNLRCLLLDAVECPEHMKEPDAARSPWVSGLAALTKIKDTHQLGRPVDEAFSAKLQRKLASTMPPRPIVHLGFDEAMDHLTRLFKDGSELIDVLHYTDSQCLQNFVSTFQAKKPQPLVFVRTLLQTFLFNAMEVLGSMSIRQLLDNDFSIVSMPASVLLDRANDEIEAVHDPRFAIAQTMEQFRQRAAQPFLDILRTSCQNRCRVRRTLCHIVQSWDMLQVDAETTDQFLQEQTKEEPMRQDTSAGEDPTESFSLPLSSWTYLYKLKQMEEIVQMGFELEVYQPHELAGMYWYLNFLAKFRLQHSERIKTFVVRRIEEMRSEPRSQYPDADNQLHKSLAFIRLSLLHSAFTWELSYGLSCLYTILSRLGLVKGPSRPYSNDSLRYELRMKPFASIGLPSLPTLEEFTANTLQAENSSEALLQNGENAVAGAKKALEVISKMSPEDSFSVGSHDRWLASAKNELKSCIAAGIAISAVRKAVQQVNDTKEMSIMVDIPTPGKAYHDWWIVPRILPRK